ncbi:hypothetical protein GQ42DRAFT_164033 [Ramicandelaber brevisporus]|nr:hypothetical protein GQ42DRAFT_164033 [Ramicandelaber brevisporus]
MPRSRAVAVVDSQTEPVALRRSTRRATSAAATKDSQQQQPAAALKSASVKSPTRRALSSLVNANGARSAKPNSALSTPVKTSSSSSLAKRTPVASPSSKRRLQFLPSQAANEITVSSSSPRRGSAVSSPARGRLGSRRLAPLFRVEGRSGNQADDMRGLLDEPALDKIHTLPHISAPNVDEDDEQDSDDNEDEDEEESTPELPRKRGHRAAAKSPRANAAKRRKQEPSQSSPAKPSSKANAHPSSDVERFLRQMREMDGFKLETESTGFLDGSDSQ